MERVLSVLEQVRHFVRRTAKPAVRVTGAYPLGQDTYVLRFETSMPASDIGPSAVPFAFVDGEERPDALVHLQSSTMTRGGLRIAGASYSLLAPLSARQVEIMLAQPDEPDGGPVASLRIGKREIEKLLAVFEEKTRDAGRDERYAAWTHEARCRAGASRASGGDVPANVVVIAGEPDPASLLDTLESLADQTGAAWRATIIASPRAHAESLAVARFVADDRIACRQSAPESLQSQVNALIEREGAKGLVLVRQGAMLTRQALACFSRSLRRAEFSYCDDDLLEERGATLSSPRFKPPFSRDLLYSLNPVSPAFALRTPREGAAMRVSSEQAWDYELALQAVECGMVIERIPEVLCHRRPQRQAQLLARRDEECEALHSHLERRGLDASVGKRADGLGFETLFHAPRSTPAASIIIPNKDHIDYLASCIESIQAKAGSYPYEVVVVENNSTNPETFEYYRRIQRLDNRVRVIVYPGEFNYSKIINFGVGATRNPLLLLLNNDTTVLTEDFLALLAGYFTRSEMGVVGPLLVYPDGLVQHAGMALFASGRMGFLNRNLSPALEAGYLGSLVCAQAASAVLGACQMVSRATFDAVGGYLEDLAITCNDIDFCWKVREHGLDVVYTPHVAIVHKEYGSRGSDDADRLREEQSAREVALMVKRWPDRYERGDGFMNPNLDPESEYFKLGKMKSNSVEHRDSLQ